MTDYVGQMIASELNVMEKAARAEAALKADAARARGERLWRVTATFTQEFLVTAESEVDASVSFLEGWDSFTPEATVVNDIAAEELT